MAKQKVSEVNKKVEAEYRARVMDASVKIQSVLNETGLALQPFLQYSETGIIAQIRLVEQPKPTINEQGPDKEVTGGTKEEDTVTEPEQS